MEKPAIIKGIKGKVVTGVGQGSFFASLDWVKKQCLDKLGFEPWPGTLNLEVLDEDVHILELLKGVEGITIVPPDPNFCEGKCLKTHIDAIPTALVVPEEKVRVHGGKIIEILAPVKLKEALNITDGDVVSVFLD